MRRTSAIALGVALCALSSAMPSVAQARTADCLAIIGGVTKIDGRCAVQDRPGGGFVLRVRGYFAAVTVVGRGVAEGYGQRVAAPGFSVIQAIDDAGRLRRAGACWVNETSRLCARALRARR